MQSHTHRIAEFAHELRLASVPKEVTARAKALILEGLGCALYSSDVTWTQILAGVVRRLEPKGGTSTLWGRGETASPANAALVNGTMVQGYELDDTHSAGSFHSCAVVLPAAFAAAEAVGPDRVSGEKLLTAIIAGFEIGPRVGLCMNGEKMVLIGWHAPAITSPFAAAVAAGRVLGLNADQLFHALGIAGTQACGLGAAQFGSMVKRMQCAKGAQSGLYAALLAKDGFTGIDDVFEEPYGGYCSTISHSSDQFDLSELVNGLGSQWETMRITIKIFACGGGNQTAVNAIDELICESGLRAADVDEITIGCTGGTAKHHGWWPYVPKGLTAAQIHMGFCVAMRLLEGDVFVDQMVEANVARPDLVELANRIKVMRSAEREHKGKEFRRGVDMKVKLRDGGVLEKTVDFCLGSEQRPLSAERIAAKYRCLAARSLPQGKVAEIEQLVNDLEHAKSIAPLIQALRGGA